MAHPQVVPPRYFGPIVVEAGGVGAGTVFRCSMYLLGRTMEFRAEVTEPMPGRVLSERIEESGAVHHPGQSERSALVTTFTVVELGGGRARVTIETRIPKVSGMRGAIERLVSRWMLPRIYEEELDRLAAHVGGGAIGEREVVKAG